MSGASGARGVRVHSPVVTAHSPETARALGRSMVDVHARVAAANGEPATTSTVQVRGHAVCTCSSVSVELGVLSVRYTFP